MRITDSANQRLEFVYNYESDEYERFCYATADVDTVLWLPVIVLGFDVRNNEIRQTNTANINLCL